MKKNYFKAIAVAVCFVIASMGTLNVKANYVFQQDSQSLSRQTVNATKLKGYHINPGNCKYDYEFRTVSTTLYDSNNNGNAAATFTSVIVVFKDSNYNTFEVWDYTSMTPYQTVDGGKTYEVIPDDLTVRCTLPSNTTLNASSPSTVTSKTSYSVGVNANSNGSLGASVSMTKDSNSLYVYNKSDNANNSFKILFDYRQCNIGLNANWFNSLHANLETLSCFTFDSNSANNKLLINHMYLFGYAQKTMWFYSMWGYAETEVANLLNQNREIILK